jgi:hypothetical protein
VSAPASGAQAPLIIEKSISIPVSAAALAGGRRIQLVLDVTLDPQG